MKFDTLKEQHAKRNPEDLEIDYGMCLIFSFLFSFQDMLTVFASCMSMCHFCSRCLCLGVIICMLVLFGFASNLANVLKSIFLGVLDSFLFKIFPP